MRCSRDETRRAVPFRSVRAASSHHYCYKYILNPVNLPTQAHGTFLREQALFFISCV
jgi:hypothetical protein